MKNLEHLKWLWGQYLTSGQKDKLVSSVATSSRNNKKLVKTFERSNIIADFKFDVFIAHVSADKGFVRKLANGLVKQGIKVWYDEFTLKLGDSLRRSIDYGLANSR